MLTPTTRSGLSAGRLARVALWCTLLLILLGYSLQVFTPIRITSDGVNYLQMALNAASRRGFVGDLDYFPAGYPALVAGLVKLNLARAWTLVVLNLLALGIAAAACWALFRRAFAFSALTAGFVVLAWLLSWVVVKHTAMPLSECVFLACELLALLLLTAGCEEACPRRALRLGLLGALAVAAAVACRTAGLALIPALLGAAFCYWRTSRSDPRWRFAAAAMVASVPAALALGLPLMGFRSFSVYSDQAVHIPATALDRLEFRVREIGSLALNLPPTAYKRFLPTVVVYAAGVSFTLLVAAGIWMRRRFQPADLFMLAYAVLLIEWPYYDERFLIPGVPLMAAYACFVARRVLGSRSLRVAVAAYLTAFTAVGILSLAYSVRLGLLRGSDFAEAYGGGSERNNYCAAYGDCPVDPAYPAAKPSYIQVLRSFR